MSPAQRFQASYAGRLQADATQRRKERDRSRARRKRQAARDREERKRVRQVEARKRLAKQMTVRRLQDLLREHGVDLSSSGRGAIEAAVRAVRG